MKGHKISPNNYLELEYTQRLESYRVYLSVIVKANITYLGLAGAVTTLISQKFFEEIRLELMIFVFVISILMFILMKIFLKWVKTQIIRMKEISLLMDIKFDDMEVVVIGARVAIAMAVSIVLGYLVMSYFFFFKH